MYKPAAFKDSFRPGIDRHRSCLYPVYFDDVEQIIQHHFDSGRGNTFAPIFFIQSIADLYHIHFIVEFEYFGYVNKLIVRFPVIDTQKDRFMLAEVPLIMSDNIFHCIRSFSGIARPILKQLFV